MMASGHGAILAFAMGTSAHDGCGMDEGQCIVLDITTGLEEWTLWNIFEITNTKMKGYQSYVNLQTCVRIMMIQCDHISRCIIDFCRRLWPCFLHAANVGAAQRPLILMASHHTPN
jgi:hypothetical protein